MFKKRKRLPYLLTILITIIIAAFFIGKYCAIDHKKQNKAKDHLQTQLIENYLNWQPLENSADFPNPYHDEIVNRGSKIVPALIQSQKANKNVSAEVVRALGEISSPDALSFLLNVYKSQPRQDTAIAIGSCWRTSTVSKVWDSLAKPARDKLLQWILNKKWDTVKNQNNDELKNYITDNINKIIEDCKQRSKPILG